MVTKIRWQDHLNRAARASQLEEEHYQTYSDVSGVWSILQATLGATSQGTCVRWTVVSGQVWHSSEPAAVSARCNRNAAADIVQQSRPWEKAPTYLKAQEKAKQVEAQQTRKVQRKGK